MEQNIKKWELRAFSDKINTVKFVYHVNGNSLSQIVIPERLKSGMWTEEGYVTARTNEILQMGGGRIAESFEKQRPGVMDTGKESTPKTGIYLAKGGHSSCQQLLSRGFKVTSAFITTGVTTQNALSKGTDTPKKTKITIILSRQGAEKCLDEAAKSEIERVLTFVWEYLHVWDNLHKDEIVLSFTGKCWPKHEAFWEPFLPDNSST